MHYAGDALSCLQTTSKDNTPLEDGLALLALDAKRENASIFVSNAIVDVLIRLKAKRRTFN